MDTNAVVSQFGETCVEASPEPWGRLDLRYLGTSISRRATGVPLRADSGPLGKSDAARLAASEQLT